MDAMATAEKKAHVVCVPYPAQSHNKAMLKMAKLLYIKGFWITFVNTEYNHKRFLKSGGLQSFDGLPGFKFETIPDGLPPSDSDTTQDLTALCQAIMENKMLPMFQNLLAELNARNNIVTSILSDGFMPFTAHAAHSLGIPVVLLWTIAACGFMGFYHFKTVLERGLVPLKDESYLTNGYLDTIIDWLPGMRDIRLGDLPSHIRIMDPNDLLFNSLMECTHKSTNATGLEECLKNDGYSLWHEDTTCLQWLDSKEADSVIYVNFGSITVMSPEQLIEFGWGLANSNCCFLWIIRPDLIMGEEYTSTLGVEFMEAIKDRGFISSWCAQEEVLNHVSVGGFLTHGGWNSIIESLSAGVPMLCWPFFGDQTINCKYLCNEWECGKEIHSDAKRDEVEKLVRLLMEGHEGKDMRKKAVEWKKLAVKACGPDGSSTLNLEKLVLLLKN